MATENRVDIKRVHKLLKVINAFAGAARRIMSYRSFHWATTTNAFTAVDRWAAFNIKSASKSTKLRAVAREVALRTQGPGDKTTSASQQVIILIRPTRRRTSVTGQSFRARKEVLYIARPGAHVSVDASWK